MLSWLTGALRLRRQIRGLGVAVVGGAGGFSCSGDRIKPFPER